MEIIKKEIKGWLDYKGTENYTYKGRKYLPIFSIEKYNNYNTSYIVETDDGTKTISITEPNPKYLDYLPILNTPKNRGPIGLVIYTWRSGHNFTKGKVYDLIATCPSNNYYVVSTGSCYKVISTDFFDLVETFN